jgi:hypothetical protein
MSTIKLNPSEVARLNSILLLEKNLNYENIKGAVPDLDMIKRNRVLSFLIELKAIPDKPIFDCVDGRLVGKDINGKTIYEETIKEFLFNGDDGLSNNPRGVEDEADDVDLKRGKEGSTTISGLNEESMELVLGEEIAEENVIEGSYNTIQDSRYEIKSISSISAESTANKLLEKGGMIRLAQDANLNYVVKTISAGGSSFPLQAHCNGVNLDLTIIGVDADHGEDYMVYLPGEEGISSEIITIDGSRALAVDGSGHIYLLNKDPDWDFSVQNGKHYDRLKDFSKGVSQTQLLDGMNSEDEENVNDDNKNRAGGFGIGNLSMLSPKKIAHSLAGTMNGIDPAKLPGYMLLEANSALEALEAIKLEGFSPALKSNDEIMRKLNESMENMAISAERMMKSGIDFSKDNDYKEFIEKYAEMTNSMTEASEKLKAAGSDLLHQGKEILGSIDMEKMKEMVSGIANAISSSFSR